MFPSVDRFDHRVGPLRPVFIVSSGRCGSTLISSLARLHPSILSLSEFFSMLGGPRVLRNEPLSGEQFWYLLSRLEPDFDSLLRRARVPEILASHAEVEPLALVTLPHLTPFPNELLHEIRKHVLSHPAALASVHIERLFAWLQQRFDRRVWVERSGGSLEYASLLRQQWPNAKFVLLLRDGRDTACSMARHPMFRVRLARILADCHTLPVEECLRAELPVHRFGAYWSALMMKARGFLLSVPPESVLILQYDELVQAPAPTLQAFVQFVTGEQASDMWVRRAAGLIEPSASRYAELSDPERSALDAACRPGERCVRSFGSIGLRTPVQNENA